MNVLRAAFGKAAVALAFALTAAGMTLEVRNPVGSVDVTISPDGRLRIEGSSVTRKAGKDDLKITRQVDRIIVRCEPPDRERIDLDVQLPFGFFLDVTTSDGAISVTGMVRQASLQTDTGDILLRAPWRATRLQFDAASRPADVVTPRGIKFSRKTIDVTETRTLWRLRDRLPERGIIFGHFRVKAESSKRLHLEDFEIPSDSPVKLPWQAPEILEQIMRRPAPSPPSPMEKPGEASQPLKAEEGAVFRSDVRMVNLVVAVTDEQGGPATDLTSEDFEVIEDGVPQEVTFAGSDEAPFNLAVLLDLSGSTKPDRNSMMAAAKGFVKLCGGRDRIAVYALANDVFHVVSNLADDHEKLLSAIGRLPDVSGASPLYDAIVLAYAEDLHHHPGERNALIVISDGIDNQLSRQEAPSKVKFKRLVKAASEMHALIYPVFLRSGERFGRGWSQKARRRMEQLADASGGRLFPAHSIQDLEPVFPLVEEELRSVYSVAYYPKNQNFDNGWRSVQVRVKRPGVTVRARQGYYAR